MVNVSKNKQSHSLIGLKSVRFVMLIHNVSCVGELRAKLFVKVAAIKILLKVNVKDVVKKLRSNWNDIL